MKIDRLIGMIAILLQREQVTAPELAERFEVSRRTISRDIETLCRAGVPIVTTQGSGGGISILDGYKIEKALLSRGELQAVFSGLRGIDSVSKVSCLRSVTEKLSGKNACAELCGGMAVDLSSHYQKPLTEKIEQLKAAMEAKEQVSFRYYYAKGEADRRIEPYLLVFRWSSWYVLGYCLDREGFRLFKLNRLWNVRRSGCRFVPREIPEEALRFDDYFSTDAIHLKALFSPGEKYRLIEEYGMDSFRVTDSGELLFEWDFASYENLRAWIFSFGDRVRILEPRSLREDRRKQAENILGYTEEQDEPAEKT